MKNEQTRRKEKDFKISIMLTTLSQILFFVFFFFFFLPLLLEKIIAIQTLLKVYPSQKTLQFLLFYTFQSTILVPHTLSRSPWFLVLGLGPLSRFLGYTLRVHSKISDSLSHNSVPLNPNLCKSNLPLSFSCLFHARWLCFFLLIPGLNYCCCYVINIFPFLFSSFANTVVGYFQCYFLIVFFFFFWIEFCEFLSGFL